MKKYAKWFLYILSIFPVYIIIIIAKIDKTFFDFNSLKSEKKLLKLVEWLFKDSNLIIVIMVILLIISFFISKLFIKGITSDSAHSGKVVSIKPMNIEYMSFVATYLIPLFTFEMTGIRSFFIFVFTYVLMGMLYVKANIYYSNIGLFFSKFNIYAVTIEVQDLVQNSNYKFETILIGKNKNLKIDNKILFSFLENSGEDVIVLKKIIEEEVKE